MYIRLNYNNSKYTLATSSFDINLQNTRHKQEK